MRTLDMLQIGENAKILGIDSFQGKQRLLDLGFVDGAEVKCEFFAPLGDPFIISIKNYRIALRKSDARNIKIV